MANIIRGTIKEIEGIKYEFIEYDDGTIIKKTYAKINPSENKVMDIPEQEEVQAEILLNQAEILTNQNSQDEVLAEILLNSLEVSANV